MQSPSHWEEIVCGSMDSDTLVWAIGTLVEANVSYHA